MKTSRTVILVVVLVLIASVCPAAYVIHLKDGRSFETSEYQTEGDQIKFKRYGGVIGIPKDEIQRIEEVTDFSEKAFPTAPKSSADAASRQEIPANAAKAAKEKTPDQQERDAQLAFMKEKRRILAEKKEVSQAFKAAKEAKDKARKDMLWQRLFRLREELRTLKEKVIAENNGVLPPWWNQIP